jgi:hypothetical protein
MPEAPKPRPSDTQTPIIFPGMTIRKPKPKPPTPVLQ